MGKLEKVGAIDRLLENIVAKSDDLKHHLYQKGGKSGHPIRGKYVLVTFHKFDAATDDDALEKAEHIIEEEYGEN